MDHAGILDSARGRRMVDFRSSTSYGPRPPPVDSGNICGWRFFFASALSMTSFVSLRNHLAVLDSPRPGRIMNFWSSISLSFTIDHIAFIHHRSPRCRQPSTIATPRCHSQSTPALAFTIDRCAFIHHRPQRSHLVLICSVTGYVKFLSKGKHIKSWYICGHVWILAKGQTRFVLIYTAGTMQK